MMKGVRRLNGIGWIETYMGKKFSVFQPMEKDIHIFDIAHALSFTPRFSGHLPRFISVAEHSYTCSKLVDNERALNALLHDASEAYLTDIPRPIKYRLPEIREIEDRVQRTIYSRFGCELTKLPEVHEMDRRLCVTEGHISGLDVDSWEDGQGAYEILNINYGFWKPERAKHMFLERFRELYKGGSKWD